MLSRYWFILIFIVIVFAIGMGFAYRTRRREVGGKVAIKDVLKRGLFLGVIVIILVGLFRLFPDSWRDHVWAFFSLLGTVGVWVLFVTWLRRKRQAGSVLLDLGRPKGYKQYLFGGCFGMLVFIGKIVDILEAGGEIGINDISYSLILLSCGVLGIFFGLSHFEIREGGILYLDRFAKWKKIESYEWTGENDLFLTLRFRQRFPFFRTQSLPIPDFYKDTVKNLLARHLQGDKNNT